jgi:poly(A) polymerase Pap1
MGHEEQNRMVVLAKLNDIFKTFVKKVSIKNNLPESIANEAGGKVFSFGSYRLGVHGKGKYYCSKEPGVGEEGCVYFGVSLWKRLHR